MCNLYFYPRSPCGERRQWRRSVKLFRQFLSTLSLRRATVTVLGIQQRVGISIHALLAESDQTKAFKVAALRISIHALLAESDQFKYVVQCRKVIFLSTLSLRRATIDTSKDVIKTTNFYPRSPCGERRATKSDQGASNQFLSTLSLRRATLHCNTPSVFLHYFYPRSPCGERPLAPEQNTTQQRISIHALLAESDSGAGWL